MSTAEQYSAILSISTAEQYSTILSISTAEQYSTSLSIFCVIESGARAYRLHFDYSRSAAWVKSLRKPSQASRKSHIKPSVVRIALFAL
jgi:hypothetical protein